MTDLSPELARVLPSDGVCDAVASLAWRHRSAAPRRAPVHPLVLLSAKKRPSSGFRVEPGRLGSWANTTRLFHMTHIAKTGGRSVREELLRFARPVGGAEQCFPPFIWNSAALIANHALLDEEDRSTATTARNALSASAHSRRSKCAVPFATSAAASRAAASGSRGSLIDLRHHLLESLAALPATPSHYRQPARSLALVPARQII